MPNCSPRILTSTGWIMVKYERHAKSQRHKNRWSWWDETAIGKIAQIREKWRTGLTGLIWCTFYVETNWIGIHASEHQVTQGEFLHCACPYLKCCSPTESAMLLCLMHGVCCLSMIHTGEGCKWLEHVWHLPLQTNSPTALASQLQHRLLMTE